MFYFKSKIRQFYLTFLQSRVYYSVVVDCWKGEDRADTQLTLKCANTVFFLYVLDILFYTYIYFPALSAGAFTNKAIMEDFTIEKLMA